MRLEVCWFFFFLLFFSKCCLFCCFIKFLSFFFFFNFLSLVTSKCVSHQILLDFLHLFSPALVVARAFFFFVVLPVWELSAECLVCFTFMWLLDVSNHSSSLLSFLFAYFRFLLLCVIVFIIPDATAGHSYACSCGLEV